MSNLFTESQASSVKDDSLCTVDLWFLVSMAACM